MAVRIDGCKYYSFSLVEIMHRLYRYVHSPAALLAFEAAARLSSFTKAADELNVTQPAISQAIKKVESALGVALFERRNRGIHLTPIGERFYTDISFGLMHILRSAEGIAIQLSSQHVTLSCSTAFAHYWMVPRLSDFRKQHPGIEIRVQTTDREIDFNRDNISLAVRRGTGEFPGYHAIQIAEERLYPVASPTYLTHNRRLENAHDLLDHALIHLEEPFRLRPKWTDWFEAQGIAYEDKGGGLRLNDYALVIHAALSGEGIALGWHHIVENLIDQGVLTKLMTSTYDVGRGFYVVWPKRSILSPQSEKFLNWLQTVT